MHVLKSCALKFTRHTLFNLNTEQSINEIFDITCFRARYLLEKLKAALNAISNHSSLCLLRLDQLIFCFCFLGTYFSHAAADGKIFATNTSRLLFIFSFRKLLTIHYQGRKFFTKKCWCFRKFCHQNLSYFVTVVWLGLLKFYVWFVQVLMAAFCKLIILGLQLFILSFNGSIL